MGTPYSSVSVSGFNSSPPSDDGTQTDANKVYWATIKTKLADPLNTAAAAINSALVAALAYDGVSKASDYTTVAGDNGRVIEIASTVSSAVTITLGQVATVGTNYFLSVINLSTISQTIARGGSDTINKSLTSLTLPPLACVFLQSNASGNGYDIIGSHGVIFGHPTIEGVTATGATGTGALVFGTSPSLTTPTLGVAAATSINFGQTALSYYGEGTWTPSLGGNTTYTTQTGIYTRVGRLINCQAELNINAIGTGSTSTVTGLPFTVNGTASGQVGTFSTLATNVLGFWCYATSTIVTFQSLTAANTGATNSPSIFGSSTGLRFSVTFHI
jgi:hypothetical protein